MQKKIPTSWERDATLCARDRFFSACPFAGFVVIGADRAESQVSCRAERGERASQSIRGAVRGTGRCGAVSGLK